MKVLAELQGALERSELTRYEISKRAGVAQSQLSRFVHGQASVTLETAERIAEALGYEIVLREKRGARKGRQWRV